MRIGHGYDVHKFAENRKCIVGGVDIPCEMGLLGHSDADVLLHAIADALLGAAAMGDIGHLFPDTDDAYKNADSLILLEKTVNAVTVKGYKIGNIDATIIAQMPKMAPYIEKCVPILHRHVAVIWIVYLLKLPRKKDLALQEQNRVLPPMLSA